MVGFVVLFLVLVAIFYMIVFRESKCMRDVIDLIRKQVQIRSNTPYNPRSSRPTGSLEAPQTEKLPSFGLCYSKTPAPMSPASRSDYIRPWSERNSFSRVHSAETPTSVNIKHYHRSPAPKKEVSESDYNIMLIKKAADDYREKTYPASDRKLLQAAAAPLVCAAVAPEKVKKKSGLPSLPIASSVSSTAANVSALKPSFDLPKAPKRSLAVSDVSGNVVKPFTFTNPLNLKK
jgi:hypothetical protein